MRKLINVVVASIIALTCLGLESNIKVALAQGQDSSSTAASSDVRRDEINHDVQLYLLVGSNGTGERSNIPPSMDVVIKQLRSTLPFPHYRLATTFLNRVKDGGNLEVSGVGGSPLVTVPTTSNTPTFFNFHMSNVKLVTDANGQPFIRIAKFRLGLKVPIVTATARSEGGSAGSPVVQYQDTGLSTEMSVREAAPTIVGTLTTSQPGESFVLVVMVKRTSMP